MAARAATSTGRLAARSLLGAAVHARGDGGAAVRVATIRSSTPPSAARWRASTPRRRRRCRWSCRRAIRFLALLPATWRGGTSPYGPAFDQLARVVALAAGDYLGAPPSPLPAGRAFLTSTGQPRRSRGAARSGRARRRWCSSRRSPIVDGTVNPHNDVIIALAVAAFGAGAGAPSRSGRRRWRCAAALAGRSCRPRCSRVRSAPPGVATGRRAPARARPSLARRHRRRRRRRRRAARSRRTSGRRSAPSPRSSAIPREIEPALHALVGRAAARAFTLLLHAPRCRGPSVSSSAPPAASGSCGAPIAPPAIARRCRLGGACCSSSTTCCLHAFMQSWYLLPLCRWGRAAAWSKRAFHIFIICMTMYYALVASRSTATRAPSSSAPRSWPSVPGGAAGVLYAARRVAWCASSRIRRNVAPRRLNQRDRLAQRRQRRLAGGEAAVERNRLVGDVDELPRVEEEDDRVAHRARTAPRARARQPHRRRRDRRRNALDAAHFGTAARRTSPACAAPATNRA